VQESNPPPAISLMLHQLSYTLYSRPTPRGRDPFGVAGLEPATFSSFRPCVPRHNPTSFCTTIRLCCGTAGLEPASSSRLYSSATERPNLAVRGFGRCSPPLS